MKTRNWPRFKFN